MTAKDVAIELIRAYVERGDSIKSLKDGQMAMGTNKGSAQIGGYLVPGDPKTKYSSDYILVTRIGEYRKGKEVKAVFKLADIFKECRHGIQTSLL